MIFGWPKHNTRYNVKGISCKRVYAAQIVRNLVHYWFTVKKGK